MSKPRIIAEVAQGYEGRPELARLLTIAALKSGADAIKFQLVYADELVTPDYKHHALFSSLEMEIQIWRELKDMIHEAGKSMFVDLYGEKSLEVAKELGVDGVKISTTDFYNDELRQAAIKEFSDVFISVGGIPLADIDSLASEFGKHTLESKRKITLLHGLQAEPTPLDQNNLLKLKQLKMRYPDFDLGFMDHSDGGAEDGLLLGLVVLGVGVSAIEKHITLDRELQIEDYVSGLTPSRFIEYVRMLQKFAGALGSDELAVTDLEEQYRVGAAKVVVATRSLRAGQPIERGDVALKRSGYSGPGTRLLKLSQVVGSEITCNKQENMPILQDEICVN